MDAKSYLNIIKRNRALIRTKTAEKQYWLDMAANASSTMDGDRVQSSGSGHSMEIKVVEAVLIDQEIERLKQEIKDVIHTLERLKPNEYKLLHSVYVQERTLKEFRMDEGKSYSWATTTKRKALRNLQKLLEESEKCI